MFFWELAKRQYIGTRGMATASAPMACSTNVTASPTLTSSCVASGWACPWSFSTAACAAWACAAWSFHRRMMKQRFVDIFMAGD